MTRARLLAASLAAIVTVSSAGAQSNATAYLVKQAIEQGCDSKKGTMDASGIIERDLDGDGLPDLILADDAIRCSGPSPRSLNCGMQVCSVTFFMRRGQILQKVHEMLGGGVRVGEGRIPKVFMYAHGGKQGFVRWNGKGFDAR